MTNIENKILTRKDMCTMDIKTMEDIFDVYNFGLAEDRGYDISALSTDEQHKINNAIKNDYIEYFKSLRDDNNFIIYSVRYLVNKPIAVCRVANRDSGLYIEGLETHRDYRKQGHGKAVLAKSVARLKEMRYSKVFSVIRKWNKASLNTHYSADFKPYKEAADNYILYLDI